MLTFDESQEAKNYLKRRWRRWLGQQFSRKLGFGVELIHPTYNAWLFGVLDRRQEVSDVDAKQLWLEAIDKATSQQFHRLDLLTLTHKSR